MRSICDAAGFETKSAQCITETAGNRAFPRSHEERSCSRGRHRPGRIGAGAAHGAGTHGRQIVVRCPHDSRTKATRRSCARDRMHESEEGMHPHPRESEDPGEIAAGVLASATKTFFSCSASRAYRPGKHRTSASPGRGEEQRKKEPRLSPGFSCHSIGRCTPAEVSLRAWIRTRCSSCRCSRCR